MYLKNCFLEIICQRQAVVASGSETASDLFHVFHRTVGELHAILKLLIHHLLAKDILDAQLHLKMFGEAL